MSQTDTKNVSFFNLLLPVIFLTILIVYGLIIQPRVLRLPPFPLEIIFLLATVFSSAHLIIIGFKWKVIQDSIVAKLAKGFPAVLILFAIGIIIGTWMISGTIPMLIYYGIKLINPSYMYILAFIVPIIFSTMTGTSWGSVGTIGGVIIGIASSVNADLGITAGAIIGGAYFGDKMSPLSDTTNLAAMAVDIDLYDHIKSMMYTTIPSAIISAIIFFSLGFIYPPLSSEVNGNEITETLVAIESMFNFNIFLLIPPIIVLYGSIRKKDTLPILLGSSIVACLIALIFQDFTIVHVMEALKSGFNTSMVSATIEIPEKLTNLFNRGGLFQLNEVIVFTLMVLTFIGTIDVTQAMEKIVNRVFSFTKTKPAIILSSLFSTAFVNSITSNQSATSFIIGDAFKRRYDNFGISRRVLSRSIEDYGTMLESVVPWTATTLFMSTTLGVPFEEYWNWQLLSLINLIVAPLLAILGIGCFYKKNKN